jgi:hypothetical protein
MSLMDFVFYPPGCGRSVTDFLGLVTIGIVVVSLLPLVWAALRSRREEVQ